MLALPVPMAVPPVVMRLLPWLLVVLLLVGNIVTYWMIIPGQAEHAKVWEGPLMPGRAMVLPQRPPKKVVEDKEGKFSEEPLADLVDKKQAERPDALGIRQNILKGYVVNAGTFVLKLGADALMRRLQDQGLTPYLESRNDLVALTNVQAGPFEKLAKAREAEAKLKAGGLEALVEETWEGYIISLGKFYLLGYAVQAMEQAEELQVKPLRMVKVEAALAVHHVMLGPFANHGAAKEVSARISNLGLAVPVIKEWTKEGGVKDEIPREEEHSPPPKRKSDQPPAKPAQGRSKGS